MHNKSEELINYPAGNLLAHFKRYIQKIEGSKMQSWLYLFLAIVLEVAGTTSMKLSEGFTKTIPSIVMFIFYVSSLVALTFALRKFDMSMAYAIWAGLGTALITIVGIIYFKESISLIKIGSIALIIIGVVGLHLSNKSI
jgi:small multidrug resistance pump